MYIPKHKLKVGGKVPGKLLDAKTKRQYLGEFVRDHKNNYYKGTEVTSKSEKLILQRDEAAIEKATRLRTVYRKPSAEEYAKGEFIRYFIMDSRSRRIIETDKPAYLAERKEKKRYRKTMKLIWYIKGNPEDQVINGFLYPGIKAKNQDVVNQAEKVLPGIGKQVLFDLAQFVKI